MNSYSDISYLEQSVFFLSCNRYNRSYNIIIICLAKVAHTGSQLCLMVNKLQEVEQNLNVENMDEVDEMYVMELLESMTEVNNEYQNLRKDLQEVQQLQRDVTTSLRSQMRHMQRTFQSLKQRIVLNAAANGATVAAANNSA